MHISLVQQRFQGFNIAIYLSGTNEKNHDKLRVKIPGNHVDIHPGMILITTLVPLLSQKPTQSLTLNIKAAD